MLYDRKNEPLTPERFRNPGSEYRGAPFWAWNDKLDKETLLRQIAIFEEMGFGGFHMHVRTGLDTPYLSDEYLDMIKACNQEARERGMLSYLYDEDRWPSGAAGGLVTADWRYRERYGRLSPRYLPEYEPDRAAFDEKIAAGGHPVGYRLACYRVTFRDGYLEEYRRLPPDNYGEADDLWYVYLELSPPSPWFNNQAYVNTLDKQAVERFIALTHERYYAELGDEFSKSIPSIFTDEPQFKCKQSFDFAGERKDLLFPFTDDLPDTYRQTYGCNLMDTLPELFWEIRGWSQARYRYHDHLCDRFTQAYPQTIGDWCARHNLPLTGHVNAEQNLTSQTYSLGEAMRSYPHFGIPGIDLLLDGHEFSTLKQAQSIVHQCGREGMLSELYGVTNWDFDFKGHKRQGDWQAALGVTLRVPHLCWMTMRGEAKRDYPASIFYQSPWYQEYPLIENHFARLNTALTRGVCRCRIGVIHPIESFWLLCGPKQQTAERREQAEADFSNLVKWLLFGLLDFDFIDESLLPSQHTPSVPFRVGEMAYDAIVVPPCVTLRRSTVDILRRFLQAGGALYFFGDPPELVDAAPSDDARELYAAARHASFNKIRLLETLEPYRTVDIRNAFGERTEHLLYQLRQEEDAAWLFVSHVYPVENWFEQAEHIRILVRGLYQPTLYDTMTGAITPAACRHEAGNTIIETDFYAEDSLLFRLEPASCASLSAPAAKAYGETYELPEPSGYTLSEPNALLLDMAEYALDDEPYRPREEILRIGNHIRARLGYPIHMEATAQPWVIEEKETPANTLRLRMTLHSDTEVPAPHLALEIQERQTIVFNGEPVALKPDGYYVDACIQTIPLPPVRKGENVLELTMAFGKKTCTEWCYLLGDFGVEVRGAAVRLTEAPARLFYGDVLHQGLPFYGGNVTYHMDVETDGVQGAELFVPRYKGPVLSVEVDGERAGAIAFAPHTLDLGVLPAGRHTLSVTLYGNRVNTFGCVHNTNTACEWFGPDCWRTEGNSYAYQYQLKPFGVIQNPQIRLYRPQERTSAT